MTHLCLICRGCEELACKRKETYEQCRISKRISGNKLIAAGIAVKLTKSGEKVEINETKEVRRERQICLFKRFSLTYDNTRMETDYTRQNWVFSGVKRSR